MGPWQINALQEAPKPYSRTPNPKRGSPSDPKTESAGLNQVEIRSKSSLGGRRQLLQKVSTIPYALKTALGMVLFGPQNPHRIPFLQFHDAGLNSGVEELILSTFNANVVSNSKDF